MGARPLYEGTPETRTGRRTGAWPLVRLALVALLWSYLVGVTSTRRIDQVLHAKAPPVRERCDSPKTMLLPMATQACPLCLSGGDAGPYFSLEDLRTYTPPPPKPHSSFTPPIWNKYPPELLYSPVVERSFAQQTVDYLAQHEVQHGDRERPLVALTFDCEAGPTSTRHILATLEQYDVKATFFVLGKYAYMWPEVVRELVDDGHEVGNHSFFHPLFTAIAPITATTEVTLTEAAVARAMGEPVPMRFFRFPYAGRNNTTRLQLATLGYQSAFWDIDPRGWEPGKTPEDVVEHMRKTLHNGAIVIMHCGSWNDARALPDVIKLVHDRGYTFGTLSDVLGAQDRDVPGYTPPASP
jgi:peptidoglycan/xylan/chitin deacetylase (PgdA/CDA1 family)